MSCLVVLNRWCVSPSEVRHPPSSPNEQGSICEPYPSDGGGGGDTSDSKARPQITNAEGKNNQEAVCGLWIKQVRMDRTPRFCPLPMPLPVCGRDVSRLYQHTRPPQPAAPHHITFHKANTGQTTNQAQTHSQRGRQAGRQARAVDLPAHDCEEELVAATGMGSRQAEAAAQKLS